MFLNTTQRIFLILTLSLLLTGCMAASEHKAQVQGKNNDKISVGTVQKEIKVGMSGADVMSVLGSPNIVTTDSERREVWAYDKISTEQVYSKSKGFGSLILLGASRNAGASSTSQKTITIIIKFDKNGLVRDFAYRQSSF